MTTSHITIERHPSWPSGDIYRIHDTHTGKIVGHIKRESQSNYYLSLDVGPEKISGEYISFEFIVKTLSGFFTVAVTPDPPPPMPKPPLCRMQREGAFGPVSSCKECGSSNKYKWFKNIGCIHPECDLYYDR